ncbi:rod shape-determining protein MreD [Virgibacillus alimentarius]|uniref:Rod shape-determining protein MreD n=1 Tax=Virgibacillus alimentarius TaxID=698769 RepID=A0ABS4S8B6_9BACI|nr:MULTISPECIES: rod shape-determining protein MreD [Virgibacillus]MBP2256642.1 rod shape-determining protein MreD [Virgibacillus alimentarius]HLR67105.1 rod shape-determining protein MreD [Virgibacillus sp.]
MKRLYLPLILFFLMTLEGVALELLPAKLVINNSWIIPHWVFMFLVLIAVYYDLESSHFSVIYGVIFGLLIDIVYTGVLGVYMFSYAFSISIIYGLKKMIHANIYGVLFLGLIGTVLTDISINFIYTVVGMTDMGWGNYFLYRLFPTILANLLFLIVLYPLITKQLVEWRREQINRNRIL